MQTGESPSSVPAASVAPPGAAHWGFWGTLVFGVVIGFAFVTAQTITIAAVLKLGGNVDDANFADAVARAVANGYVLSIAALVSAVVGCALVAMAIAIKRGSMMREYLALRAVAPRTMLRWIAALVVVLLLFDALSLLLGRPIVPEFMRDAWDTRGPLWLLCAALVLAAPLFEEVFFRGFLLTGFEATFLRPAGAIVVTAVLWALIHTQYGAYEMTFIFVLGLLFATARIVTRSLVVPIVLHAITNLAATVETALLR